MTANFGEYDFEPVPGLPGHLPPGEQLLWQGRPRWGALARRSLRIVPVGCYFLALAAWRGLATWSAGGGPGGALRDASLLIGLGAIAVGVLCLIGWAAARATVYSITSRRVVIRHGISLQLSLNLPLRRVHSASLATFRDGTGDLALQLGRGDRIGYLVNWPHVRPWHWLQPQPSLRALADAPHAAAVLEHALAHDDSRPAGVTHGAPVAAAAA